MVEMHEQEQRQLDEDMSNPNDNNDHHTIPRQNFGPYYEGGAKPKPTGTQPSDALACDVGLNILQARPSKNSKIKLSSNALSTGLAIQTHIVPSVFLCIRGKPNP